MTKTTNKVHKLYDVPRNTYIRIVNDEELQPPFDGVLFFEHIDGMYSCVLDKDNNLMHLAAWTEVEITTKEEFLNQ